MRITEIEIVEQRFRDQSEEELYQLFQDIDTESSVWRQSRRGSINHAAVAGVQYVLNQLGYGPVKVDGWYGQQTANAVRKFQEDNELAVDGDAGRNTISKMKEIATDRGNMPGDIEVTALDNPDSPAASEPAQQGGTGATATGRAGDGTRGSDRSSQPRTSRSTADIAQRARAAIDRAPAASTGGPARYRSPQRFNARTFTANMDSSQATQAVAGLIRQRRFRDALAVLNYDERIKATPDNLQQLRALARQQQ